MQHRRSRVAGELVFDRSAFRVRADPAGARFWVDLGGFCQEFRADVGVDSLAAFDRTVEVSWLGAERRGAADRLTWTAVSTLWSKRLHLDVYRDHAEFHAEVSGNGDVDAIRYFDTITDAGFVPHFALTKHFNDKGQTDSREYSTGSPVAFPEVFCPEPNSHNRQFTRPYEYAQVSVNADLDLHGGNFIANPGPLCFAIGSTPGRQWLGLGLAVEPGGHLFSEYEYLGGADFALRLNSWGAREIRGKVTTPRIILAPASRAHAAIGMYADILAASGLAARPSRVAASWWERPIVCGWGHQSWQGDLFRVRSSPERPPDNAVYTLCTQATYRDIVEHLDGESLPWGTLVIDARWFLAGGLKNVDVGRWPDLRGFIDAQHRQGRKVLLWWGPWDPEGLPEADCIRYLPGPGPRKDNRPGRMAKFGTPQHGKKLCIDICLPRVRRRIRDQVRLLLSPAGFNADGLKLDHVSAAPGVYGMAFPEGSERLFGIEAVRSCLALIYQAAKEAKADALVIGQSPTPYLADVQDMLRLGDIYSARADSVTEEMAFRASMTRQVDPDWLIDTDGWPLPSLAAMRDYIDAQPSLGVPSLYYATHLDTTGEALTSDDYARIRKAWTARLAPACPPIPGLPRRAPMSWPGPVPVRAASRTSPRRTEAAVTVYGQAARRARRRPAQSGEPRRLAGRSAQSPQASPAVRGCRYR
jgi:hypothetical protein